MNPEVKSSKDHILLDFEDRWETDLGAWFAGERVVFRGKDLFSELRDMPWMGLLLYGMTGRFFDEKQIRLCEGIWVLATSYPEPRLWNNRIAAYAGTARSSLNLGLGAAIAVSEAKVYGHQVNMETVDFLFKVKALVDKGEDFGPFIKGVLKTHRRVGGYGRPIVRTDERISPLLELASELGLANGPFVKMVFEIEKFLLDNRYRMKMNISALSTALLADQGFEKRQIYYFRSLMFTAGIIPCYLDAVQKPAKAFFPLRCSRIHYNGRHPPRTWES
jgi:hypothetical protein